MLCLLLKEMQESETSLLFIQKQGFQLTETRNDSDRDLKYLYLSATNIMAIQMILQVFPLAWEDKGLIEHVRQAPHFVACDIAAKQAKA